MKKQLKVKKPTQEEIILKSVEFQLKKLVFLLYKSKMPEEVKMAWIELLPQMPPEQIDQLVYILEIGFANVQTKKIDQKFQAKLKKLTLSFKNKQTARQKRAQIKINQLKKAIKTLK